MIWGVRLEPGKIHCENVSQDIHLTMAAMESWDSGDNEKSKSLVFLQVQQSEYLLCTLTGVLLQQHLDMRLTQGEKLTFSVRGKNSVYLTGYSENVSDISSQGDTNRLEEDDNWEDNWISKDAHTSDQDAAERAWEDETEYSQPDDSNASQSQEMAHTSIIPVTIKTERVDEDNLESVSDLPNADDSQLHLEMDEDDAFDKDVEEKIGSASLSLDRVSSNSRIEGTRLISPSRSNSNCIPTMMGSGVRLQPPVCVTSSLDVRLPGGLMPLGYPSPRQLLPQIAKMGVPHDPPASRNSRRSLIGLSKRQADQNASLSYQTSMLNKLKLLQQSLNPSNFPTASNHSFLLPQPRFTSPILQKGSSLANSEKATFKNASSRNVTFVCPTCKRIFTHKGHFKKHVEGHHGEKLQQAEEFKCRYCEKVFVSKHRLRTHEHGHEGVRPYKCQICGKGFTQSGTCRRHERIHVGFKPFKCRFCTRTFLQTKDLKKHEAFHLRELMKKEVSCL